MGPRSIDRGIVLDELHCSAVTWLQWGRDQLIAEFYRAEFADPTGALLQWGRDQLIAELLLKLRDLRVLVGLQWGRDQLIAELGCARNSNRKNLSFNGAAIN